MVLRTSGRVGSRRFTESLEAEMLRGFFCARKGTRDAVKFPFISLCLMGSY